MLTEIKKKQPQSNKIFSDLTKQHKTTISLTTMTDFLPSRMHTKADSVGEMWKMYNSLWQAVLWPDKKIFFLVSCWLAHDKSPWRSIFVNARVWKSDYIFLDWLILNNLKWFYVVRQVNFVKKFSFEEKCLYQVLPWSKYWMTLLPGIL